MSFQDKRVNFPPLDHEPTRNQLESAVIRAFAADYEATKDSKDALPYRACRIALDAIAKAYARTVQ
jgi:hypothetical protein